MEKNTDIRTNKEPIELPPGFRFHPTDEELITHYLSHKVLDTNFSTKAIGEVDLNRVEPWDLPWKAKMGEKEWYFFCVRDRKYPTGLRTNRATEAGYWKATGKDKEIIQARILVGMKKTLVFYGGRAPKGVKTDWVMHEYRLEGKHSFRNLPKTAKNEWVICRIFKKCSGGKTEHVSGLPPLRDLDLSSGENNISTAFAAEGSSSHVTCFSNPTVDPRDILLDDLTSFSSRTCAFSPLPFIFPKDSTPNSFYSSQIIPFADNLSSPGSVLMHDQSMVINPCEDRNFPNIFNAPVDLDCLWNY